MPSAPTWKWEWNLNTLVILFGFAAGLMAWGATWEKLSSSTDRLEVRVTAIESRMGTLDNHELRLANVEQQAVGSAAAMRAVEQSIGQLSSDIRVVREILQRLESRSGSDRIPP